MLGRKFAAIAFTVFGSLVLLADDSTDKETEATKAAIVKIKADFQDAIEKADGDYVK